MLSADAPIGVMDAGFGGYTVIRELQKLLPCENIVFFGDGKNQPYGNRSREEILCMTRQCLRFLQEKKVKAVAVACNHLHPDRGIPERFPFPDFQHCSCGQR